MNTIQTAGLCIVGLILLIIVLRVFFTPLRWLFKLGINTGLGYLGLFVLNWLGSMAGFTIGINLFNAIITGLFGVPGLLFLYLAKWLAIT